MTITTKLKYVIVAAAAVVIALSVWCGHRAHQLDTKAILARSVLKDRNFNAKVQEIQADGMSAYLLEEHSNPLIAVNFLFRHAGSAYEAENKQGLTTMLAAMLLNGAGAYNALRFKDISEEYGVRIGFDTTRDAMSGYVQMPTAGKKTAIDLLTSALYRPHFSADYLALTKKQMLISVRKNQEQPGSVLGDKFAKIIFAGHPYQRPDIGTPETIAALNAGDLRAFMQEHFTKDNLIIGIAGDISAEEAKRLISDMFGRLPQEFKEKPLQRFEINSNGVSHYIDRQSPQAITAFIVKGTERNSADFYPLYVANYIFGGSGLNSRISKVVREENGLTYGIYTYLSIRDLAVSLAGGYSATPDNFERARQLLLDEWKKLADKGVTAKELKQAKESLTASHNLRFASTGGIADMLVAMQKYRLGQDFLEKRNDYVRNVTLPQVNTAARKYFGMIPDFVIIGAQSTSEKETE